MNKADLNQLYKLEEKLQLIDAKLIELNKKIPVIEEALDEFKQVKRDFQRDRKDVWEYIHTLTLGLREGEVLKKWENN